MYQLVNGDFNHDGKLDIAVVDADNGLEVFMGNGNGTFQKYAYSDWQFTQRDQILEGDLNNDGNLDLLLSNSGGMIVTLGNRDGTFQAPLEIGYGERMALGDLTGNGKQDLVFVAGPFVNVAMGNGNGTFQTPSTLVIGAHVGEVTALAVGDFTGNGKLDILVATANDADVLDFFAGNGDGTFQAPVTIATGVKVQSIAAADLNGDGKPDLVTADGDQHAQVWMGDGDGTFQKPVSYLVGSQPISVSLADLSGDGKPDIVTANSFSSSVSVLLNKGDGTFGAMTNYNVASGPTEVTVGDFTGDGIPDIAAIDLDLSILPGNGDGTFQDSYQTSTGPNGPPYRVTQGDLTGDGLPDIVTTDPRGNGVSVVLNEGHGAFSAPVFYSTGPGSNPQGLALDDLTGNGILDLVVADAGTNSVSVFPGNGDGTFGTPETFPSGGDNPTGVAIGDLNGDGKQDIVAINSVSSDVSVFFGNGDGTFDAPVTYVDGAAGQSHPRASQAAVVLADFTGDGKIDIATQDPAYGVSVLLNNGNGTFGQATVVEPSSTTSADIVAADLNGDGRMDLVAVDVEPVPGILYSMLAGVLLGNGDGTFKVSLIPVPPDGGTLGLGGVAVADFSGDGIPDLVIGSWTSAVAFLQGIGDGTFQSPVWVDAGPSPFYLTVGNFDGNGLPEVVAADTGNAYDSLSYEVTVLRRTVGTVVPPDTLSVSGPIRVSPGAPFNLTVRALNASGAVDTGFTGTVSFVSTDPTAVLPSPLTFTAANQGVFTISVTLNTVGNESVTATDTAGTAAAPATYPITVAPQSSSPVFTDLSAPSITFGTPSTTISGRLYDRSGGSIPAGESVSVTLAGVSQTATLDAGDDFSTTFATGSLPAGGLPYPIGFTYAGDEQYGSATAQSRLTVTRAVPSFSSLSAPTIVGGTTWTAITGHVDANAGGPNVPAGERISVTLAGVTQTAPLDPDDNFVTTFVTGSLTASGSPYAISFSYPGNADFTPATGQSSLTVLKPLNSPTFSLPSAPIIVVGAASTVISGHLDANAGGPTIPAGEGVAVTLAGVTQTATLDANDDFSTTFDTSTLLVTGPAYAIDFGYAGDGNFAPAAAHSSLTVLMNANSATFTNLSAPTIVVGADTVTFSGHLDAGGAVLAGEFIDVDLDTYGVVGVGTDGLGVRLDANNNFSATFDLRQLAPGTLSPAGSPYSVIFAYGGDDSFAPVNGYSSLTVLPSGPTFSRLSAPSIVVGTAFTRISGHLAGSGGGPSVAVTLAGATQTATLDANGDFTTTFATGSLAAAAAPYPIDFAYASTPAVTAHSTLSVAQFVPTFGHLSAPIISYGTAQTVVTGHLDPNGGQNVPAGEVISATLAGVTQTAVLDAADNFTVTFATGGLSVVSWPRTISFSYAGDGLFAAAASQSTLLVQPAATNVFLTDTKVLYDKADQYFEYDVGVLSTQPVNEGVVSIHSLSAGIPGGQTLPVTDGTSFVFALPLDTIPPGLYGLKLEYRPGPDYLPSFTTGQLGVDAPPVLSPITQDGTLTLPYTQFPYTVPVTATSVIGNPLTYSASVAGDNPIFDLEQKYRFTGLGYLTAGATAYVLRASANNTFGNPYYLLKSDGGLYAYDGSGSYAHTFANNTAFVTNLDPSTYADPTLLLGALPPVNYTALYSLQQYYQFTSVGYVTAAGVTAYVLFSNHFGPGYPGYHGYYVLRDDGALFPWDGGSEFSGLFWNGHPLATLSPQVYTHPDELLGAQAAPTLYAQLNALKLQYDLQDQGSQFIANPANYQAQWLYSPILNQYGQHWYTLTLNSNGTRAVLTAWQGYGDPTNGTPLATLDPTVFNHPRWLTEATAPPEAAVNATVDGSGNLTIALPNATYTGSFKVTLSVSDGQMTSSESLLVTSTDTPPTISVDQDSNPVPQGASLTVAHGQLPLSVNVGTGGPEDTVSAAVSGYSLPFALQERYQFRGLGYFTAGAAAYVLRASSPNGFGNPYYLLKSDGGLYAYDGSGSFAHTFATVTPLANLGANTYFDPALLIAGQPAVDYTSLYTLQQQYQFTGLGYFTTDATAYVLHSNQPGPGVAGFYLLRSDGTLFPYDGSDSYAFSFVDTTPIASLGAALYVDPAALLGANAAPVQYPQLYQLEQHYDLQEAAGSFHAGLFGNAAKWLYSPAPNARGQHWYTLVPSADASSASLYAWDGGTRSVPANAQPLAVVDGSVYANPGLLINAKAPPAPVGFTASLSGNTLTINGPSSFVGTFEVTVTATDGVLSSSQSFLVTTTDTPPALSPLPDQTVSASGGPLQLTLGSTDAEGDTVTYSVQVPAYNPAYNLQQIYHFTGVGLFTIGGVPAYVLHSDVLGGVGGYYLLRADGGVYAYDGSGSFAHSFGNPNNLIASLDPGVFNNPTVLTNAQLPPTPAAVASLSGNTLTVDVSGLAVGTVFEVFVTASDGAEPTRVGFRVTVTA
jgi:hypothetical protein